MSKSVGLILRLIAPVVVVDRLIAADQIHSALVPFFLFFFLF